MNRSGKERLNAVNTVMIRCWEYIQDFCEVCKEHQEEAEAAGGTVTVAETLSEILSSIAGTSEVPAAEAVPLFRRHPAVPVNQQRLRQGLKQDPRLLRASLAAKTLLPRLSRKQRKRI